MRLPARNVGVTIAHQIQRGLVDVVTKLILETKRLGIAPEGLCRAGWDSVPKREWGAAKP